MSHRFSQFIERHCGAIAYSSLAILAFAAALSFNIHVDDNFYTKFVKEHPMSQSIDLFAKSFNFVGNIDVVVKPKSQGPFDSKTLEQVTKLEHEIAEHPVVTRIASARQIQDEIKGEISDEYPGVEGDAVRSAITRVLVNYGAIKTAHNDVTNELRSVIYLKSLSTDDLDRVLKHIDIVKAKYEKELEIRPSGFSVIRSYINGRVISDFAESFFMTFVLIFLCYFWLFKNWRWALLALVPNAIPLLTISGLMSLFQVDVDTNLVILICVAFGIVGDNTIHLSYVVRSEQEKGASYNEALARAMNLIGPALLATSGVFLVCLPVFLLGNLRLFDHVAIFLSISFVMAFLADLFMFPAIQTKWGWSFNPPLPTNEPRPSNYSDMSLPILVDDHSTQKYQGPSHKVPARDSEIQL